MGKGNGSRWFRILDEPRDWEDFYRSRWAYERSVRTSHGVNCSGSCSWEVFVKDGLICWELQKTDYPQIDSEIPNYEPRGCQRGISSSWYPYSPVRPKYPYVRGVLLDFFRLERSAGKDPVEAWASIVEDPQRSKEYREARGKAGWRRVKWDEVLEIIVAAKIYTIKKYGPDHLASFSPIPAMSMVSFLGGHRLSNLLGGAMLSFYEWYHDLPHIMPMMWGDQTDVHESADWYQSAYWIVMGSNLPMTRTPDCHYASEFKYNGGKIVNLSPNYSDVTKFADLWVPVRPGTDAAFLLACIHVILKEFHVERKVSYFLEYVKKYTNLPFLVLLEEDGEGNYLCGRFLRSSDVEQFAGEEHADWKLLMMDSSNGELRLPGGSVGFRWEEKKTGRWNLKVEDVSTGKSFDPLLTCLDREYEEVQVRFADFTDTYSTALGQSEGKGALSKSILRGVSSCRVEMRDGTKARVTTAYDLLLAQFGISRGFSGDYPQDYDDASRPFTPAWQEQQTGVDRKLILRVAREWADTAEKTRGKCLFITGSGILHWYHGGSLIYRAEAVMGILTGCMGVNGGGFAHYAGTEKIRNYAAIGTLGAATDWVQPPRHMNSTSYFYFHTDQWRYDGMTLGPLWAPWAEKISKKADHAADMNSIAVRLGWLPFYPQVDKKNPLELVKEARASGASSPQEIADWVARQFKEDKLRFALTDIDAPENHPKVLWIWRGNLIGTSMRGHEYALKHLLGTHHNVLGEDRSKGLAKEIKWQDNAPLGKLDLIYNVNLRMDSSANYSDIVLPTAHWYEKFDLTCTDLHTFFHPFTPAHDPPWETRSDWEIFKAIAKKFSELAEKYFPEPVEDLVMTPMITDSPDELAQPLGEMRDWEKNEAEPVPGKTFPKVRVVKRDYARVYEMFTTFGPLVCQKEGYGAKGIRYDLSDVYEQLKGNYLIGAKNGRPSLEDARQVAELILRISPESDGELSYQIFKGLEKRTGLELSHLVDGDREIHHHFPDLISQPKRSLTSPHWSAIESQGRTYCPWTLNIETLKPFHTLTGRQEIYFDHRVYRELGEMLPTYKPPVDMVKVGDAQLSRAEPNSKVFRFITPHGKWSIHSMFWDSWHMLNMFRGGQVVWINDEDAREIGVEDNDWVEIYNENGICVVRAVVSHTMPRDSVIMYHMSERHINVPFSPLARQRRAKDLRGGTTNAPTRIMMNPATMVGGYANWTYFLNYWGTSPSERDCAVFIRKMPLEQGRKKVIYQEKDLRF